MDNDCGCKRIQVSSVKLCSSEDPYQSIRKVVQLMENPISSTCYDRHFIILNGVITACKNGFYVRDIAFVVKLLDMLTSRIKESCLYYEPTCALLKISAITPILIKTSEFDLHLQDLQIYFSVLGYLIIRLNNIQDLQDLVINAIVAVLKRESLDINRLNLTQCHKIVAISDLPLVVAQFLELIEEKSFTKLLNLAHIIANISPVTCEKMIKGNIVNFLLIRLHPNWKTLNTNQSFKQRGSINNLNTTCDTLWTLLASFAKVKDYCQNYNEIKTCTPNLLALWSWQYTFQILVLHRCQETYRNHILQILLLCVEVFEDMPLSYSRIPQDISILSVASEMGTKGTWASSVCFSKEEADYEFKKMLLLMLCYCSKNSVIVKGLQPKRIIPGLIKLMSLEINDQWYSPQQNKLVSLALHTLKTMLCNFSAEFLYYEGPSRLLLMINYLSEDSCNLSILKNCLSCLKSAVLNGDKSLHENIIFNNGYYFLTELITKFLSTECLTLQAQHCISYIFSILSTLNQLKSSNDMSDVTICINIFERIVKPQKNDSIFDPKFIICVIDFFWECVVWNDKNLKMFIFYGGVYKLLDIIERCIFPIKLVGLGALVDICEKGNCIPHLITWRNKGKNLFSMILELFREENRRLGVKITESGLIADIEIPIMGLQQWYETFYEYKDPDSSPATIDLLSSCRPKIYALIQLLTNRHELRVAISNEHYCMFNKDNLNTLDQITLLLAENFLALKLGEVWVEIGKDIENVGIRPLAVDGEVVSYLQNRFYKWSLHLKTVQQQIINQEIGNDYVKEKQLYKILRESKLIESLQALRQLDFIGRTTEKMFRYICKMKQTFQIDNALNFTPGVTQHKTYMRNPKVTFVFNHNISVESDIIPNKSANRLEKNLQSISEEKTIAEDDDDLDISIVNETLYN